MTSLKNKRALVTGATSGIGEATAYELARRGCWVAITGRRQDRLQEVAQNIRSKTGSQVVPLSFDVRVLSECEREFREIPELSELDILVNNAGLAKGVEPMDKGKFQDWESMIDTNIKGLLYMTRLALSGMKKRPQADIINLGSVAGRWVYPGGGVYCATKYAVRALTEGLRMDLIGTNIRVTNIEPGRVETEFSLVRLEDEQAAKKVYEGMRPLTAADIAECIVWTLERPQHVNIQEMVIFPTDQASITMFHKK